MVIFHSYVSLPEGNYIYKILEARFGIFLRWFL